MRRVWQGLAWIAVLAALVGLAVWASRGEVVDRPGGVVLDHGRPKAQGDYFVSATLGEPPHLNPLTSSHVVARRLILNKTHDTLLRLDPATGALTGAVASRWEQEPGGDPEAGLRYVLELRDDVRFSDGAPLTMADVLFPFELLRAEHALPGSIWGPLERVAAATALDERRLRLELRDRHFAGLAQVATAWPIVQRDAFLRRVAAKAEQAGESVPQPADRAFARFLLEVGLPGPGTGPYKFGGDQVSAWRRGRDLTLVQHVGSWRRRAQPELWNLAGLRLLFLRDAAAIVPALRRGELDFAELPDAAQRLAGDPDLAARFEAHVYEFDTLGPWFIVWNHEHAALRDVRVRRALSLLVPRAAIAERLAPRAVPATAWFRPGSPRIPKDLGPPTHDPQAALELLTTAGFGPAEPLSLRVMLPDAPDFHALVDLVEVEFRKAGITLVKEPVARAVMVERRARRDFDGYLELLHPDPWNDPFEVFHSTQRPPEGGNWMHFDSAAMDRVLEAARTELDPAARRAHWFAFCNLFRQEQPVTMLYHQRLSVVLDRRFRGVELSPSSGLRLEALWVRPQEQRYAWGVSNPP
ncbi:MAG: ABC transporter substrate-binding protein [Planctomycetota bacterium]